MCDVTDIDKRLDLLQKYRGNSSMMQKLLSECDPCQSCSEAGMTFESGVDCSCRRQYQTKLQNEIYFIHLGISKLEVTG